MTTVFLHIGIHKTGTSSVQDTLALNRALLASRGLMFPASLPNNHSNFFYDAFSEAPELYHANRARGLDRPAIAARTERTLASLRREIAETAPRALVLSAEDGCTLKSGEIASLRRTVEGLVPDPDLRVVLYTRHPVDYVRSAVQENVKGNGLTADRAKAIHIGASQDRYRTILTRWGTAFGPAALTVRSMEAASRSPGGLVGDILGVFGVGAEGMREVRRNEGAANEVIRFLAERNAAAAPPLRPADMARLVALKGNRSDLLTEDDRRTIWARSAADRSYLAENWGIDYAPAVPGADEEAVRAARHEVFLTALAAALPDLAPDLAAALAHRFGLSAAAEARR